MSWRERKQNRKKQILIGIFLAGIMIFSAFGIYLSSVSGPEQSFDYKDHKFEFQNGRFVTKINNKEIPFYNLPHDLELINLSAEALNVLRSAWALHIAFDPNQENVQYIELTRFDWGQYLNKPMIQGVTNASSLYSDLPVLSCANATQNGPVILLNSSPEFSSKVDGNCVTLNAFGVDFLRWRDKILYFYLGIMDQG